MFLVLCTSLSPRRWRLAERTSSVSIWRSLLPWRSCLASRWDCCCCCSHTGHWNWQPMNQRALQATDVGCSLGTGTIKSASWYSKPCEFRALDQVKVVPSSNRSVVDLKEIGGTTGIFGTFTSRWTFSLLGTLRYVNSTLFRNTVHRNPCPKLWR